MKIATVLTAWTGDGETRQTAFRPAVCDLITQCQVVDISEQSAIQLQPSPNLTLCNVIAEDTNLDTALAAIELSVAHGPLSILCEEEMLNAPTVTP